MDLYRVKDSATKQYIRCSSNHASIPMMLKGDISAVKVELVPAAKDATSMSAKIAEALMKRCRKKLPGAQKEKVGEATLGDLEIGDEEAAATSEGPTAVPVRQKFSDPERFEIYNRDEGRCQICGKFVPPNSFTVDHIVPLAKGGSNEPGNLQCSCLRCNWMKADMAPDEFAASIAEVAAWQAKLGKIKKKEAKKVLKMAKKAKGPA